MVIQEGITVGGGYVRKFQGVSTDISVLGSIITIKTPIELDKSNSGSSFLDLTTGDYYKWHIDNWYKL